MEEDKENIEFENAIFPHNIANSSNKEKSAPKIVFRNYRPFDDETLNCEQVDKQTSEEAWQIHLD